MDPPERACAPPRSSRSHPRAPEIGRKLGTPEDADGLMTRGIKSRGSSVPVSVVCAFAEMSSDVGALADVIASALAADHIQFFSTGAMEAKGMYKQRIRRAWGHAAHRGWARLLLDRRKDLIVHRPRATRGAGCKTDDDEQRRQVDNHCHYFEQFRACASSRVRL
jgi:hypothetical protein